MSCQPLVNLGLIIELFPSRHRVTVYRWNRESGGRGLRLPAPDLVVGVEKLWTVESILSWADEHKLSVDSGTLKRVLEQQNV